MNLSEFIEKTSVSFENGEHKVSFNIKGSDKKGNIFVKNALSDYDAKERAFFWLKEIIEK